MILYNVTISIDQSVHDEWLAWMKSVHIPAVMNTGCFTECKMLRVLGDDPEQTGGGHTYAVQYSCNSMDDFIHYEKTFADPLRKEHAEKYKDKFVAFRTLLERVS